MRLELLILYKIFPHIIYICVRILPEKTVNTLLAMIMELAHSSDVYLVFLCFLNLAVNKIKTVKT